MYTNYMMTKELPKYNIFYKCKGYLDVKIKGLENSYESCGFNKGLDFCNACPLKKEYIFIPNIQKVRFPTSKDTHIYITYILYSKVYTIITHPENVFFVKKTERPKFKYISFSDETQPEFIKED